MWSLPQRNQQIDVYNAADADYTRVGFYFDWMAITSIEIIVLL